MIDLSERREGIVRAYAYKRSFFIVGKPKRVENKLDDGVRIYADEADNEFWLFSNGNVVIVDNEGSVY